jgi:hypothetical protein
MKRSVLIKALFPVLTVLLLSSAVASAQTEDTPTPVTVDIKPGSCKNPFNLKSKGVLPVVVLGSETLDVANIDVASIRLSLPGTDPETAGVHPVRSNLEDVAVADCAGEDPDGLVGPDGWVDLVLKFRTKHVVELLPVDELTRGETVILVLTGTLTDDETETETAIMGEDTVTIIKKKVKGQ